MMTGEGQPSHRNTNTPLELAYVGDAVFELAVRERLARRGPASMKEMHRQAVGLVRASAQAALLRRLDGTLGPDEEDVVRRARNAKSGPAPKGAATSEYRWATGLEALLGQLYLDGRQERLAQLLDKLLAAAFTEEEDHESHPDCPHA